MPPVIFHVRLGLRRRTDTKPDSHKAVLFIKAAGGDVLLMRVQLEPVWEQLLCMMDQSTANARSLNLGRNIKPVDVAAVQREKSARLSFVFRDPEFAA